jgi:hypothetical protein
MDTFVVVYGVVATLLATGSIGMIVWGAVRDGKRDR